MSTPNWDRTLLGGSGRKTAEVQRSRSSVGTSSSSNPSSPCRRSSGYSPKPYKKRSQRVLLHDLSDPTSLPSQLAAAQQAAAAAGHDVPPSYTSHYFSLPPSDYMLNKKNRFTKQHEQEKVGRNLPDERYRGSETSRPSVEDDVPLVAHDLDEIPVTDVPLYTEAYKDPINMNEDIGSRVYSRASARTRRTAFAQKPIQPNLLSSSGESSHVENKDSVDNANDPELIANTSKDTEKNNNAYDPYSSYYQHYPHHYYRRPQNISSLRQSRSLSKSPPPSQASSSASRYTAAAASRFGERGVGTSMGQHSPLHISSSSGKVVHPRRTPLSATLSDSMHSAFGHRDPMYHMNSSGINYMPTSPSLQRSAQYKSDEENSCNTNQYLPMQLSQQQAEARNLVLNEIKDLQLRRQSSFKRILRLPPIWRTAHAAATFQSSASSSPTRRTGETDSSNMPHSSPMTYTSMKGEASNMGSSSAGSGGGTPDRNRTRFEVGSTPDRGTSPGQSEVDGQIQGSGMFSESLMSSILPGANSKLMQSASDRWHPRSSRHQGSGVVGDRAPSSGSTSLKYSQSLKDPTKDPKRGATRERRKHSDPALGNNIPRISGEEATNEGPPQPIANHQSGSSSNSSLSTRSLDSPHFGSKDVSGSAGMHAPSTATTSKASDLSVNASSIAGSHNESVAHATSVPQQPYSSEKHQLNKETFWDSDFEAERDPPDWRPNMNQDELARLKPKEKKRQDVINELFHTERTHVRKLKVLNHFFYLPLQKNELMPKELFNRLFANLPEVLKLHVEYNQMMKNRIKSSGFPIGSVSEIISDMFDGSNGDRLIQVGSEFTKIQKYTIEELKQQRIRDHKLDNFLTQQESLKECRRLQLQAILPAEHQRLVKYPLMLEQLAKQCEKGKPAKGKKHDDASVSKDSTGTHQNEKGDGSGDDEPADRASKSSTATSATDVPKSPSTEDRDNSAFVESAFIKKYVERTREIVDTIDKQVAQAQNIQRLVEIQQNLDLSGLEKFPDSPISIEYRNVDLTKHRLIYDGVLTMKIGDTRKIRTIELHVILLEDCIMLLQKQDEKYVLKFHTSAAGPGIGVASSGKFNHSPVIKFSTLLVRPVATDKRAFYLLNTTQNGPQIYELVANSTADRSQWFRHITEASNAYKQRGYRQGGDPPTGRPQNGLDDHHHQHRGKHETGDTLGVPGSGLGDLLGDKKGQPTGRSHSFHEQSTSSREPHPERQPSSPPEDRAQSEADTFEKKTEKLRRKDAEVAKALEEKERLIADILHIPPPPSSSTNIDVYGRSCSDDINNDMTSSDALNQQQITDKDATKVLLAALEQAKNLSDLVNESLTLSEEATVAASADVSRLSSPPPSTNPQLLHPSLSGGDGPFPLSSTETGTAGEIVQGTQTGDTSVRSSNDERRHREFKGGMVFGANRKILPGPPPERLVAITNNMNSHLTSLLAIFRERDEERDRLRRELTRSQEQVHALLSQSAASHRASSGNLSAAATISESTENAAIPSQESRPVSYISVEESSGPEMSEKNHESEDDASATITTTTTITLTTELDPDNNNDSVSIPIKTTTTKSSSSSLADRDNNNKVYDSKNKGDNDTHPQNSQVSKITNKGSNLTSASTEERSQSTEEQINPGSQFPTKDHEFISTDPSQVLTPAMTPQEQSTEKAEELNDNKKPEDISNEKADSSVVLDTTSTTSEV